jgi:hypothetical protein
VKSKLVILALLALSIAAHADTPPAATFVGTHYEGVVSESDDTDQTGAITTRFGLKTLPFKVTTDTKIWKTVPLGMRNLAVGQKVMAIGKEVGRFGTEFDVYVIDVIPDLPPANSAQSPKSKGINAVVLGTIATVGDDLTLTDRAGATITLHVKGNKVLVGQTLPGQFRDIDEGRTVKLDGKYDNGTFIASRVVIQPGQGRKGGAKPGAKLPPLAVTGETALATTPMSPSTSSPSPTATPAPPANKPAQPKFNDGDFGIYDLF